MNDTPWENACDPYRHNGVYYQVWRRLDENGDYIYNCTVELGKPPLASAGGFYSRESMIKTKFGT